MKRAKSEWCEVYDFLEFTANNYPDGAIKEKDLWKLAMVCTPKKEKNNFRLFDKYFLEKKIKTEN